jgi:hypothetical protein
MKVGLTFFLGILLPLCPFEGDHSEMIEEVKAVAHCPPGDSPRKFTQNLAQGSFATRALKKLFFPRRGIEFY